MSNDFYPTPGQDSGTWGGILNALLQHTIDSTGGHKYLTTERIVNNTGGQANPGDLLVADSGLDLGFATTTTSGLVASVYVATEIIGSGATGIVAIAGGPVTIRCTGSVSRGDYVRTSTGSKTCESAGPSSSGTSKGVFGIAIANSAVGAVQVLMYGYTVPSSVNVQIFTTVGAPGSQTAFVWNKPNGVSIIEVVCIGAGGGGAHGGAGGGGGAYIRHVYTAAELGSSVNGSVGAGGAGGQGTPGHGGSGGWASFGTLKAYGGAGGKSQAFGGGGGGGGWASTGLDSQGGLPTTAAAVPGISGGGGGSDSGIGGLSAEYGGAGGGMIGPTGLGGCSLFGGGGGGGGGTPSDNGGKGWAGGNVGVWGQGGGGAGSTTNANGGSPGASVAGFCGQGGGGGGANGGLGGNGGVPGGGGGGNGGAIGTAGGNGGRGEVRVYSW